MTCRLCGNRDGNRTVTAREMMLGLGDRFEYLVCGSCGCVQIGEVPRDLGRYYPGDYYSYQVGEKPVSWRRALRRHSSRHVLGERSVAGWVTGLLFPPLSCVAWPRMVKAGFNEAILDVGCGGGNLLRDLRFLGFRDLTGVDAFLPKQPDEEEGFRIVRGHLGQLAGRRFAVVMAHHVLEHMHDPAAAVGQMADLLEPGGRLLLRTPLADSYAWRTYGADWVQLDAPRHLHLFTVRNIEAMAHRAGLEVVGTVYDSGSFQFWASEQIRRGIPLHAPESHLRGGKPFTRSQLRAFRRRAAALNAGGDGDQAAFVLARSGASAARQAP